MNMSSQQILTLVSALDSYRRYMKDVVYNQSKSIEHTPERDEIVQSLRLSQTLAKSLEMGKEIVLDYDDYSFIQHSLSVEISCLNISLAQLSPDTVDYFCAKNNYQELNDLCSLIPQMTETQIQLSQ